FCEQLFRCESEINIQWKTDKHWRNEVFFIEQNVKLDALIHCLIHVFITYRLNKAIEDVIKNKYFFSNEDEITRIVELTNWIIFETEQYSDNHMETSSVKEMLFDLFKTNIINKQTVHFDSVIKFQMQSFKQYLI